MKALMSTVFLLFFGAFSTSAFACNWPTKPFACCSQASAWPNSPQHRVLSGCALNRADATARCLPYGVNGNSISLEWDRTTCPERSGSQTPAATAGHACSVSRRGDNSFTYYYYETRQHSSKDELCAKARNLNTSGRSSTHYWYTTFTSNQRHKAIAECENGTWVAYGVGIDSILKVNELRKERGGRGCLFKVDKSWNPSN